MDSYQFWSDGISPPVVRVERKSHNATYTTPETSTRFRIDSETPGAVIKYGVVNNGAKTIAWNTSYDLAPDLGNPDIVQSVLEGVSASTAYISGDSIPIGATAGNFFESRKDYVKAAAAYSTVNTNLHYFTGTAYGYEGAFRSVVLFSHISRDGNGVIPAIAVQGSNVLSSIPTISGFPLMDQTPYTHYMRQMYRTDNTRNAHFAWTSWEIVSDWYLRSAGYTLSGTSLNAQLGFQKGHIKCTYGNTTYISLQAFWQD
ncbi:hypothetical protein [Leadbettera azotonutricia]|uniref:Uncharacterized protein n=1 Tax=Leadbettera azotonutricia (strain ATCC BAA-888 / DSM 13862 / ZAS-9) TaxID=545695 RepID=F5Y733_LEAAZ|nr:hypothetical protein [Leadbettera azotonutricia]AEF83431.1 hypothetical protein TREAZ_1163 [Leadbettera azotonutricia ZAS-9]